mgnify:CR=1 FL=1
MSTTQLSALDIVLRDAEIIVSCGSGGVGKTTTAAALAMITPAQAAEADAEPVAARWLPLPQERPGEAPADERDA